MQNFEFRTDRWTGGVGPIEGLEQDLQIRMAVQRDPSVELAAKSRRNAGPVRQAAKPIPHCARNLGPCSACRATGSHAVSRWCNINAIISSDHSWRQIANLGLTRRLVHLPNKRSPRGDGWEGAHGCTLGA